MKRILGCLAVVCCFGVSIAIAAELKSGLQPGDDIGAFNVVKCAGAEDDGVGLGDELCYRCKYGARPMVMVFTRNAGDETIELVKQLDAEVKKNNSKQLRTFVNLIGEDRESLEKSAKELGASATSENVPVVVPVEFENGPENYGINPDAEVTVLLRVKSKVVANHAVAKGEFNDDSVKAILADVEKILE